MLRTRSDRGIGAGIGERPAQPEIEGGQLERRLSSEDETRPLLCLAMAEVVYVCGACRKILQPSDDVVQTVRTRHGRAINNALITQKLIGEWFHTDCWSSGIQPFEEIDRGALNDVLARK